MYAYIHAYENEKMLIYDITCICMTGDRRVNHTVHVHVYLLFQESSMCSATGLLYHRVTGLPRIFMHHDHSKDVSNTWLSSTQPIKDFVPTGVP